MNKSFKKSILFVVLAVVLFAIAIKVIWFFLEVKRKGDLSYTVGNLRFVYKHLESYKEKNGEYPCQQDMNDLLKTLNLSKNDLPSKRSFDIGSAVYHAPTSNSEYPTITMSIGPHILSRKKHQIFLDKDIGYYENIYKK